MKKNSLYGPKIAALLADQYDFDTLIMAAILTANEEQTSLYLITGFRLQADLLMQAMQPIVVKAAPLGEGPQSPDTGEPC